MSPRPDPDPKLWEEHFKKDTKMTINLKEHAKMTASIRRDRNKYKKALELVIKNTEQSTPSVVFEEKRQKYMKCHECFVACQIAKDALRK